MQHKQHAIKEGDTRAQQQACEEVIKTYSFDKSIEGWAAGFADYPKGQEDFYELSAGFAQLPAPLPPTNGGFRISGNNHSDDLFMFIKTKICDLKPNQEYTVSLSVEFATSAANGSIGVGGSPGESVWLKAGLTSIEPQKDLPDDQGIFRMNIDKNNQAESGKDMIVIGDVSNGKDSFDFTLVQRQGQFSGKTNENGEAWLILGTDSGYEATTTLYYTNVTAKLTCA